MSFSEVAWLSNARKAVRKTSSSRRNMVAKYYWTQGEEARLLDLYRPGITDPKVVARELNRKAGAVQKKLERLAVVVVSQKIHKMTTTVLLDKELLTHEQALKILAAALEILRKLGLEKIELQRFRILVDAVQTYDSVLEKFERWSEVESRLLEMDKKITELQKAKDRACANQSLRLSIADESLPVLACPVVIRGFKPNYPHQTP